MGLAQYRRYSFRYDIDTGKSRVIAHIGNAAEFCEAHNPPSLIRTATCGGTYGILRAFSYRTGPDSLRLFRYSPDTDEMTFFDHGLPRTDDPADKSKPDTTSILGPDGMIYIGTDAGSLIRLNPATAQAELLCYPSPESREALPALAFHP